MAEGDTIQDVTRFCWDRLDFDTSADLAKSCLAEDWFVEEAIAGGSPFHWRKASPEASHRMLYRYARTKNIDRLFDEGRYMASPEWLMLHQIIELIPAMFRAAQDIHQNQRAANG